jgi:hypothetical protein
MIEPADGVPTGGGVADPAHTWFENTTAENKALNLNFLDSLKR